MSKPKTEIKTIRLKKRSTGIDPFAPTGGRRSDVHHDPCLILGNDHKNYKFGPYQACLTENQEAVLFRGKRNFHKLGCGVFACAFEGPTSDTIVKLTRDSEDVAALIAAQGSGVVPKVYEVYELKQRGRAVKNNAETPVFAMIIERLKPVPEKDQVLIDRALSIIYDSVSDPNARGSLTNREIADHIRQDTDCTPIECKRIEKVARETRDAINVLRERDIYWYDIHAGNIAYDENGRVKVIDLGVTGTQLKQRPTILAGLLAGAARRVRRKIKLARTPRWIRRK